MGGRRTLGLVTAALVLGGCGGTGSPPRTSAAAPAVVTLAPGDHVCLDRQGPGEQLSQDAAAQARPVLGPGEPAGFVECVVATERLPGRGEWTVRRERRAAGGAQALAAALRLPDLPATGGGCLAYGQVVPELYALDDDGPAVLIRWPVDGCGHLRSEVAAAHGTVRWAEVASRPLRQITPQAALDSGCASGWKDMAAVSDSAAAGRRGRGSLRTVGTAGHVRACTYRITERGETPFGSFESGGRLEGAAWQVVLRALEAAPPAPIGCRVLGQRFIVLSADAGEPLYVELDGCRRVLTPDGGLRTATPQLLQELSRT